MIGMQIICVKINNSLFATENDDNTLKACSVFSILMILFFRWFFKINLENFSPNQ
jgi:hypothetical protein